MTNAKISFITIKYLPRISTTTFTRDAKNLGLAFNFSIA